jgi:hypothetical protein
MAKIIRAILDKFVSEGARKYRANEVTAKSCADGKNGEVLAQCVPRAGAISLKATPCSYE